MLSLDGVRELGAPPRDGSREGLACTSTVATSLGLHVRWWEGTMSRGYVYALARQDLVRSYSVKG